MKANGRLWYDAAAAAEDRATLGSDPSAVVEPYGTGEIPRFSRDFAGFSHAIGLNAINPNVRTRMASALLSAFTDQNFGQIRPTEFGEGPKK